MKDSGCTTAGMGAAITVGTGKPGDVASRLRAEYLRAASAAEPFV